MKNEVEREALLLTVISSIVVPLAHRHCVYVVLERGPLGSASPLKNAAACRELTKRQTLPKRPSESCMHSRNP